MLPQLLANKGYKPEYSLLSTFDTLNDDIRCNDLATALEYRAMQLESTGLDMSETTL